MNVNGLKFEEVQGDGGGDFVKFDQIGQQSIGMLEGIREKEGKFGPETVLDFASLSGDSAFSITAPYDLKQKAAKLVTGNIVRITYIANRPTAKGNSMKIFRVETAPPPRGTPRAASQPAPSTEDVPF